MRDLAGVRYGSLVGVRPVRRTKHGIVWRWRCDCGGSRDTTHYSIKTHPDTQKCCSRGKDPYSPEMTLEEIAKEMGCSKQYVSQLLNSGMRKVKAAGKRLGIDDMLAHILASKGSHVD